MCAINRIIIKKHFSGCMWEKNPNPQLARFTTSWKTGNTLRKTIKMIIIFFIVISLFQMLWLNEYFLSIIFYRLDLQEKTFERNRRELFSFPNFFCFSSATCASFQNPNLTYFICSNFLTFQSGATLCVYVVIVFSLNNTGCPTL